MTLTRLNIISKSPLTTFTSHYNVAYRRPYRPYLYIFICFISYYISVFIICIIYFITSSQVVNFQQIYYLL